MSPGRAFAKLPVLLLLLTMPQVKAQSSGSLRGTVTDTAGEAVAGVELTLVKAGTPVAHARSSAKGEFHFDALAPGRYDITSEPFHGLAAQDLALDWPANATAVKLVLAPATVLANVQVDAGQALSTAAADNQNTVSVSAESLTHLPVFDQDLVATLTPFLDASSVDSGGVSIVVDGVELKQATVTPSAVASLKINRDPYSAEWSSPGRGRIEITSKAGTQQYHGELNFIFRDSEFNGRNYFAPVRAPEQRRIYEGHVTGPVGHGGHTDFLVSGSRREEDLQSAIHAVGPPNQLGFDANGQFFANIATPTREDQYNGRITHDFSEAHQLSVGYNFYNVVRRNKHAGGTELPSAALDTDSREDDLTVDDRIVVSPNLIQQLAIVFEKDESAPHSVTDAPSIQVDGAFIAGGGQISANRTENTVHITDLVSWTHGRHFIRFGTTNPLQLSRRALDDHSNYLGTFSFNSVADFENHTPYQFTVQQGVGRGVFWFNPVDGFIQDEVTLRKNLQVSAGLRYQWQTYISDRRDFAPRASFAYSPSPAWVVRGGSGVFYGRTGGDFLGVFKLDNGIVQRQYQVLNPGYPDALAPGGSLATVPTSLVRESASLQAPIQLLYSATVERQLGPRLTATATYRGITGIHLFRSRDSNAPLPPDYTQRPDPTLGFVQQIESEGRSRLNALDLALHGTAGRWFTGQVQYTLGDVHDDTAGLNFYPEDQYRPAAEWGRADTDQRQRFNMLGTFYPDHWLSLGVAVQLYSGTPYTELAGSDFYNTGLGNARPAGVGRNTLQTTGTADLDLSWDHSFHLGHSKPTDTRVLNAGLSAFNVLNHTNLTDFVGNIRSPLFAQATTALPARQLQLQVRYEF